MKTRTVTFEKWKNCIEISSGKFRLIAATEVGPRILGGFLGKNPHNIFMIDPATAGKKNLKDWALLGGHRVWHSPEAKPRSYTVDSIPVDVKISKTSVLLSQKADDRSFMAKSIEIIPEKNDSFRIIHTIRNCGPWPVQCAAWALSVMAPGGVGIVPMPQGDKKGLLPNTCLMMWPYNDMGDGRISVGSRYTIVRNDPKKKTPQKIGLNCEDGWIAYQNNGITFIKRFAHCVDGDYPDNGCSVELYTCPKFQEMETLSPLYDLEPGEEIRHEEIWNALDLQAPPVACEKDAVERFG